MNLVILIQIDALRYDYVSASNSLALNEMARCGISGKIQPTFGFEPDGAYLGGLYPDECDGGSHFWRDPEDSPYHFVRWLPSSIEKLDGLSIWISRKIITKLIRLNRKWQYEFIPCAPYTVLKEFAPAPKLFPPGARGNKIRDIFFLCNENNIPWFFHGSPQHRVSVDDGVSRIKASLFPPVRFAFWHIGNLDSAGHRFGPKSVEVKKVMKQIDEKVAEIVVLLKKRFEAMHIIMIGDHGMVEVTSCFDMAAYLLSCDINGEKSPLYFIDSTMVRSWFSHRSQRECVRNILEKLTVGRILEKEDIDHYHINYKHNRFGDLIFLAEPGILFSPNYFQGKASVKGMHGYAPEHPDQQSAFIIHSPKVSGTAHFDEPVDMRRIFPTVLKLLGIEKPKDCKVDSIV